MPDAASSKRKYVRLDKATWAEIEALWEAGDTTLQELEERYDVSRRALQTHFSKRNLEKGSKATELAAAVKAQVLSESLANQDDTVQRAKAARESAYNNAVLLENLITTQLAIVQKDPSLAPKLGSILKGLSLAAGALERVQDMKSKALGLDKHVDSDDLPILVIQDLTEEELQALRERGPDEEEDEDIGPNTDSSDGDHDESGLIDMEEDDAARVAPASTEVAAWPRLVRGAT